MTSSIFAIGDIHGCLDELKSLIAKLPLGEDSEIVFLGDYVDRGAYSKQVIDYLIECKTSYNAVFLRGNHEQMFLDFLTNPHSLYGQSFLLNGGSATLASYANAYGNFNVPIDHVEFLRATKFWHETENYFFVHAGVPNVEFKNLDPEIHWEKLVTVRDEFYSSDFRWGKTIVHGHTPVDEPYLSDSRINLDTGCVFNGQLTAIQLPSREIFQVAKVEPYKHTFLSDIRSKRKAVRFVGQFPVTIEVDGKAQEFETINFNDFSMYIVDHRNIGRRVLSENLEYQGTIHNRVSQDIHFVGRIVRVHKENEKYYYAFELTNLS